jgi:FAD/FMN-containing dehydrogenase
VRCIEPADRDVPGSAVDASFRARRPSCSLAAVAVSDPHRACSKEIIDMPAVSVVDVSALSRGVNGRVVVPGDADYDVTRAGFNGMIDRRPAAIVRIASDDDAAAAIAFARERDLPLAIRSGGHSAPGHGCCDDGIVIDCRDLQTAEVDEIASTARVGAGLTWKQFDAVTQAHGLAVTGGRVSSTGVTGLTIGSGSGWLERAMGLTSDSLIGARVVTADGVSVDTDDDPDLLWALRGGGGNFGVLTELRFGLRPLGPTVFGGKRFYAIDHGVEVLAAFRDVMMRAPKELCGGLAFLTAPPAPWVPETVRGTPVVAIIVLWAGDPAGGPAAMAGLDALGEPVLDHLGEIHYTELQQIMDPGAPAGHRDYFKGGFMRTLGDDAVADIADLGRDMRAPLTQIICAPLGAHTDYAAVDETHSAIGHRDEEWSFQVLSLWADPSQDGEQKAWTKAAAERMSSYSEMVSYPNFLTADDAADVEAAYSPAVMGRLRAVKDRLDPGNVFRINNNIAPTGAVTTQPGRPLPHASPASE